MEQSGEAPPGARLRRPSAQPDERFAPVPRAEAQEAKIRIQRMASKPPYAFRRRTNAALRYAAALYISGLCVGAGTLYTERFENQVSDRALAVGAASVAMTSSDAGLHGRALRLSSLGGTAMWSVDLPVEQVRGASVQADCFLRVRWSRPGLHAGSGVKIQIAVERPGEVQYAAVRAAQDADWQHLRVTMPVPADARRVVFNAGIEAASGLVFCDDIWIVDDRPEVVPIDLSPWCNLRVEGMPGEVSAPDGRSLRIPQGQRGGRNIVALRGVDAPQAPERPGPPLRVDRVADRILILHAVRSARPDRPTPCAIWTVRFWDGSESSFSVFEGRDVGDVRNGDDLENWRVVWRGKQTNGAPLVVGVSQWRIFTTEKPIDRIRVRTYAGAAPLIFGVFVVTDPPPPAGQDADEFDEFDQEEFE